MVSLSELILFVWPNTFHQLNPDVNLKLNYFLRMRSLNRWPSLCRMLDALCSIRFLIRTNLIYYKLKIAIILFKEIIHFKFCISKSKRV